MKILFQEIINKGIAYKASDIHFIPMEHYVHIKFRVNDTLTPYETLDINIYRKLLVFMKFQAGLDVSTQQIAQSGRYTYKLRSVSYFNPSFINWM